MHDRIVNISTISISPNRNNWPYNKIKRGNLPVHLLYAYHYNVKIKQKVPSQRRTTEKRMDTENSFSLKCLSLINCSRINI